MLSPTTGLRAGPAPLALVLLGSSRYPESHAEEAGILSGLD